MSKPKLAILATHAIQHFVPVYQRLVAEYGVELKVFYIAENGVKSTKDQGFSANFSWDLPLTDGYDHEFLRPNYTIDSFSFREVDAKNVNERIDAFAPDFIWLNGYWSQANWRVILGNKGVRNSTRKIIYSSDSNLLDQRGGLRLMAKKAMVKSFITRCDHYISVSEQNTLYLEHYGAKSAAIEEASYPVDMQRFIQARDQYTAQDKTKLRERYGLTDEHFIVIFSGKLVDYKRPNDLVEAVHKLAESKQGDLIAVMLMGDGVEKASIEKRVQALGLSERVVITGFINQSEIPLHLYSADAFALTSSKEPFGAVLSEALPFGLPIISTDKVGAVGDKASGQPGKNAIVYPWGDIERLSQAMLNLYSDRDQTEKFSAHSLSLVEQNDTKVYCEAIMRCLESQSIIDTKPVNSKAS